MVESIPKAGEARSYLYTTGYKTIISLCWRGDIIIILISYAVILWLSFMVKSL